MTAEAERYVITIGADHLTVRLEDTASGEIHISIGPRALYDTLGILAEYRDRDQGLLMDDGSHPTGPAGQLQREGPRTCPPWCRVHRRALDAIERSDDYDGDGTEDSEPRSPDVMQRARLARGGRGEVNAQPGKFQRAAHANDHPAPCGYPDVIPCICSQQED